MPDPVRSSRCDAAPARRLACPARTGFEPEPLPPRFAPAARPHYHAGRHQRSSHGVGGDAEPLAEVRQCRTTAVQLGSHRDISIGKSLVSHSDTMPVQDSDHAGMAKLIAPFELWRRNPVTIGLNKFGNLLGREPAIDPLRLWEQNRLSDLGFRRFVGYLDHPPEPSPLVDGVRVTFHQPHFTAPLQSW